MEAEKAVAGVVGTGEEGGEFDFFGVGLEFFKGLGDFLAGLGVVFLLGHIPEKGEFFGVGVGFFQGVEQGFEGF